MWNKKLCLSASTQYGISISEQIKLFKKVGFDAFFTEWSKDDETDEWAKIGRENGMIYQSIHAPFGGSAYMWADDEKEAEKAVDELMGTLLSCAKNEVPIMIAHAFIGFLDHTPTEIGLERYGKVIAEAEKLGVKIAFENTEGEEYLEAILKTFGNSKCVGYCWDSGHEMCYNHSQNLLDKYGDLLIATHLNDNLGIRDFDGNITFIDDLHLLPFDGIADWDVLAKRLNKCNFNDILTFELNTKSKPGRHENDVYSKMPVEEYVTEAYKRACKVASKINAGE